MKLNEFKTQFSSENWKVTKSGNFSYKSLEIVIEGVLKTAKNRLKQRFNSGDGKAYNSHKAIIEGFLAKEFTLTNMVGLQGLPRFSQKIAELEGIEVNKDSWKATNLSITEMSNFLTFAFKAIQSNAKTGKAYVFPNKADKDAHESASTPKTQAASA